ncbi:MAG: ATP-dependent DNA ligase [Solirubrobacterales bacterium]|nr:ATP-dependent DNA ligase [Solirubrobacterales bacterium]
MTALTEIVDASRGVAESSARSGKVAILAELLGRLEPGEVAVGVAWLSGVPRQGRVGVGWSTVRDVDPPPAPAPTLTIAELDAAIAEIAAAAGDGSAGERRRRLEGLLASATAPEAAFIRRLLTGELRQGALAGVMADAVARAADVPDPTLRRALMLSGDLPAVAEVAMRDGTAGLRAVGLQLMRPILPMLASPGAGAAQAVADFGRASVEHKLDGVRVQIHRRGSEVRVFTRKLNDITAALPGVVAAALRLAPTALVLDGEALWMSERGPASFQETMSQIDADAPPEGVVTFVFDVLHVDGRDLLDAPLEERLRELAAIAPELQVPGIVTTDPDAAERVLADALRAGHEGVVVKDATSTYAAGRRGRAWRKVKPVRTYDLVVLGADWGHGRRRGWLSNLHLGARDPAAASFAMVGKCFKGLTDELLRWQTDALLALPHTRRGISVLVEPALVVEIALDGVQSSSRYPGGVALRFARVRRYRPDKDADAADTIDDLRALLPAGRGGRDGEDRRTRSSDTA